MKCEKPLTSDMLSGFAIPGTGVEAGKLASGVLSQCFKKLAKQLSDSNSNHIISASYRIVSMQGHGRCGFFCLFLNFVFSEVSADPLIILIHSHGVNIRHLGKNTKKKKRKLVNFILFSGIVRTELLMHKENPAMASFLLDVMISRTLKNHWRHQIKKRSGHTSVEFICR